MLEELAEMWEEYHSQVHPQLSGEHVLVTACNENCTVPKFLEWLATQVGEEDELEPVFCPSCGREGLCTERVESDDEQSFMYSCHCDDCGWTGDITPDTPKVDRQVFIEGFDNLPPGHYTGEMEYIVSDENGIHFKIANIRLLGHEN